MRARWIFVLAASITLDIVIKIHIIAMSAVMSAQCRNWLNNQFTNSFVSNYAIMKHAFYMLLQRKQIFIVLYANLFRKMVLKIVSHIQMWNVRLF